VGSKAERPKRETESSILVEREREHWLKLEVARVFEMTVDKLNFRVFLSMQISRTNKLSIKKGGPKIFHLIWRLNIRSHNTMVYHSFKGSKKVLTSQLNIEKERHSGPGGSYPIVKLACLSVF